MAAPLSASVQYFARRRRRIAQNISAYKSLIASPASLGSVAANGDSSAVTLPADGRLAVSLDTSTSASDISINDGVDQTYGSGGAADFVQRLDSTPKGRQVVIHRAAGCPAGACSLYVLDEWQRPQLIATATFT